MPHAYLSFSLQAMLSLKSTLSSFTSFRVNFYFNWTSIFVTKQDLLPACRWEWTWLKLEYSLSMTWAHPWRGCNLVGCSLLKGKLLVYVCVGCTVCKETKVRGSQSVGINVSRGLRDFLGPLHWYVSAGLNSQLGCFICLEVSPSVPAEGNRHFEMWFIVNAVKQYHYTVGL